MNVCVCVGSKNVRRFEKSPPVDRRPFLPFSNGRAVLVHNQMASADLVCPITQKPIMTPGITVVGSIYEYSAISEWLEQHTTDPSTGLRLPSLHVLPVFPDESPTEKATYVRSVTSVWAKHIMANPPTAFYEKLLALRKNTVVPEWDAYQKMKAEQFLQNSVVDPYVAECSGSSLDANDTIARPANTGTGLNFVEIPRSVIRDRQLKCYDFSFSDLSWTVFFGCNMSRCKFVGCKLEKTKFVNCKFVGEEIDFYKAETHDVMFLGCEMEYVHVWQMTTDPAQILQILEHRNLRSPPGCHAIRVK
jgi:hypothetical protein